ncbi:MAG: hypothetical protein ACD_79C01047G0008, partial [uncultured bacterium]
GNKRGGFAITSFNVFNMTNTEAWLILNYIFYLSAAKAYRLIAQYDNSPLNIFKDNPENLALNLGEEFYKKYSELDVNQFLDKIYKFCEKEKASIICNDSIDYPSALKEIYDPPLVLFIKGNKDLLKQYQGIAIVGSRKPSEYGKQTAARFAQVLAEYKFTIISGMARGIDTFAHKGALEGSGITFAVLGNGFGNIYPPENVKLFETISEKGIVMTEFLPNVSSLPVHFPYRNRIISGLSKGVLVIEAAKKSGSLITANCALEQNRDVWAIPGRICDKNSEGCNAIIKEGASIVLCPEDIIEDIDNTLLESNTKTNKTTIQLSEKEKAVFDIAGKYDSIELNNLFDCLNNMSWGEFSYIILQLEMKKCIKKLPGNSITVIHNS